MTTKRLEKAPKTTIQQVKQRPDVAEAVDQAIENIQEKLATEDLKPSVTDLVRLLQLRKELADERPKQVTVRWIDECETKPAKD